MSISRRRILVVGASGPAMSATVEQLARRGWECQSVERLSEARNALELHGHQIVLAAEQTSDGRAYELTHIILEMGSSLLVGVKISDGFLWLPTVERGVKILGSRAVNLVMLESTVEELLEPPGIVKIGEFVDRHNPHSARPSPKHGFPPCRKTVGAP